VLIELFSLDVTAEAHTRKIDRKSVISLQYAVTDPKFQVEKVAPTNHSSNKTRLNDLWHGIKFWTDFSSVLSRTDRIIIANRPRLHSMQRGKNVTFSGIKRSF